MSIPCRQAIENELVPLLQRQPDRGLQSHEAYSALIPLFPCLAPHEYSVRHQHAVHKFGNAVQWVVKALRDGGHLLPDEVSGRGFWQLSPKAADWQPGLVLDGDELLCEMQDSAAFAPSS